MVDLMNLLSDVLIGSFQMLMLNDLGKNMFPYRIKTCWTRILIYGVTALVILGVNHIESTFINIMMVPVSYTIASIVIFQGSVWKKIILTCCYYMLAIVPEFLFAVITGAYGVTGTENNFHSELEKLLSLLLMSTITFLLVKCVNQITRKKNYQTIENKLFTVLLTLPAATIIIFMCIYYSQISYTGVWCRLRNKIVVFEIDKKIYYGLERKYTAKSVEFNIQTDRGNLSLRGYLGPIIWEGFFPEISNNENSKGYLFHPTIQTVDGEANYDCYINTVYSNSLASEIKKTERYIKRQENVASKMQQQILNIRCSQELLSKLNFSLKCKKEYHPLLLEELLDLRTESEIENIFDNFSQEYIQYSVEMRKKILAQTILFYMNKKGVLLKDIPCTLNQILKCLSVNTDNNDIIYRWIELLKKYNYVTETDGIYVCKIEIYEKGLKYGWEEVEYLWKGKLESPLVLDYIINNIKNWDKLIQKEQQATLLLFEQGEDIYADALYKETKILQYLNHSLSKKVLGYLYENANATILEIGAGTGATSDKVLSDIRENKFEEHIVYFYTDISRFFLQRAKERYKECDGKIEMHYQTLDIDEAFSSQLPSNFQADIVIAVGVLNNSVNTDKCIYEINSVMKPGGILLIIETVEDVPDILITQSFMMTEPKDQRKATNTMFLNRKQWLEILEENGFCNSEEFPGYGEYLEVLGQKLFYCTKE